MVLAMKTISRLVICLLGIFISTIHVLAQNDEHACKYKVEIPSDFFLFINMFPVCLRLKEFRWRKAERILFMCRKETTFIRF